ncbi:MAG: IS4 family transposase [Pseudomonadales bacterium]|nr:IS4 family transposase [Pseudomonadales bacterium]
MSLIPQYLCDKEKFTTKDFSRERKLPLPFLITFILSLVSGGKNQGVDGQLGSFVRNAKRSGIWSKVDTVHRSTITRARSKLKWQLFEDLFYRAVILAYEIFPHSDEYLWEGMSVVAFDGSKYQLPASTEIRKHFDPSSGLGKVNNSRGHYPQCLVSTAYDVFRRIPIARSITAYNQANERKEACDLIGKIPSGSVLLFDRGYPSYDFIHHLNSHYQGYYSIRCPTTSTFSALKVFVKSKKQDGIIEIVAPNSFRVKYGVEAFKCAPVIKLRAVKWTAPDGTKSVLVTNLLNTKKFTRTKVIALYFKRWSVETRCRDEKVSLNIERFHSRSVNGVKQEMFAILIVAVIARTLAAISCVPKKGNKTIAEPQFKHAAMALGADIAVLCSEHPENAIHVLRELIIEIRRVKYHRPIEPRPSQPRVSKAPVNKWRDAKLQKLKAAA